MGSCERENNKTKEGMKKKERGRNNWSEIIKEGGSLMIYLATVVADCVCTSGVPPYLVLT